MTEELRIRQLDDVSSTNDVIKEAAAEGEPEGLAVIARRQSAGYGQRGNAWDSPIGGIYLSMLLRPHKDDETIKEMGQVAAIGVCRALAEIVDEPEMSKVGFKWPNDIIVPMAPSSQGDDLRPDVLRRDANQPDGRCASRPYRKLCGISTELKDGALCLGIGINGYRDGNDPERTTSSLADPKGTGCLARDGKNHLIYLEDLGASLNPDALESNARAIAIRVWEAYRQWLDAAFDPFREEYAERLREEDMHKYLEHMGGNAQEDIDEHQ